MSSTRNKVKEFFGILAKVRKSEEFFGFLGDRTGNVVADDYSNVWVLLYNGQVVLARNKVAPIVPRTPVAVGYTADDPKLLQVLRVLNVHDRSTTPYLPPHAKTHTWPGADTLPIRAEQFLPGLALPSGGMVVQYYGWPYKISSTWHLANHSTHDFTSHIPTVGAKWVGVEIDADGVITYNESSAKDSRDLLTPEDIAVTPSDRRLLFAVKVYLGQSEVIKNELDTDLFDPRFTTSDGGGGGGGSVESVTGDGVDNTDPANPVISYPTPADIGADVAGAAAAAQTAAESYADSLVVGLWDDRGTYNASGGAYPSSGGSGSGGAIKKGDIWTISVAGTLPTSQAVEVGDTVRALVDGATNTQVDWAIGQNNIGYVAENSANKATSMTGNETSNIIYLTAKAIYDWGVGLFVQKNASIAGATKTKITYDAKGLVTAGADATTADIADSTGKRYVADTTASNDFLVGNGSGSWIKKTLAEIKTILGLGTAAYTASTDYQPIDSDLTDIAGIAPSNDDIIQRKSGRWINRTLAQYVTDITSLMWSALSVYFQGIDGWNFGVGWSGTRTSGTTFTTTQAIEGNVKAGDKLKFYDSTWKFANIVSIVNVAGTRTVTISGDTLVGNPSTFYYSHDELPYEFPLAYATGYGHTHAASGGYSISTISPTTSNVSAAEGTFYIADISGLTANRDFNLPTPSAAGKQIAIKLSTGDDTYALILKINGTEWSRIFITGEVVKFISTGTGASNWVVEEDGRIPCSAILERQSAQSVASGSYPVIVQLSTEVKDAGDIGNPSTYKITIRRAGIYDILGVVIFTNSFSTAKNIQALIHLNGSLLTYQITYTSHTTGGADQPGMARCPTKKSLAVGDYLELVAYHNQGSAVNTGTTTGYPQLSVKEQLDK